MSFSASHLIAVALSVLLVLTVAAVMRVLYRTNRLLFRCLVAAIGLHVLVVAYALIRNMMIEQQPQEVRIKISQYKPPPEPTPPPKTAEKPKPKKPAPRIIPLPRPKPLPPPPVPVTAPPKGNPDAPDKTKPMPKGKTLDKIKSGKPNKPGGSPKKNTPQKTNESARPTGRNLTRPGDKGNIASNPEGPDDGSLFSGGIDTGDVNTGNKSTGSGTGTGPGGEGDGPGGEGGEDAGTPDGSGFGDVPKGFKSGKVKGRMYYVRLKHGSGAWNAHWEGTNRLLAFLNKDFKCEDEGRAMTAVELDRKYMRRGEPPTFLYIYCDDSFTFSSAEVTILRKYMQNGGFLFLDSRPDSDIRELVGRQLDKVLQGSRLTPIPRTHAINRALYRLTDSPSYGENFGGSNYGITKNGRLVVFYSPGNLSAYYTKRKPEIDYDKATYQLGANVMTYAMFKGNVGGIATHQGASGKVSRKVMEQLGFLEAAAKPKPGTKPGATVKIKPKPGEENEPEDVKIMDD